MWDAVHWEAERCSFDALSSLTEDGDADNEVDLGSYAYQIWKKAIDRDPSLEKTIHELPDVVYSTMTYVTSEGRPEGVLAYVRTADDHDALAWLDKDGNPTTESQFVILQAAECEPDALAFRAAKTTTTLARRLSN